MAKYIENIPETACFQLSTSFIKRFCFANFFFNGAETFQGKLAFRKSQIIDFSQFSSLWMLLWVFIPTSCSHRIFPRFSQTSRETHLHFSARLLFPLWGNYFECIQSLKMNSIRVESNKMWRNISKIYQKQLAFNCQLPS